MSRVVKPSELNQRNGRKGVNSYDVAELAGVSQSAVSRVFKEGASASKAMRERVMAAAEKLGYQPNAIARGLTANQSNLVAVVLSELTNLYYPEVLVKLTQYFSERGIQILLFSLAHEDKEDTNTVLKRVLSFRVDGILTAVMFSPEQLDMIGKAHIPIVFFNRNLRNQVVSSVRCDQEEGESWLVDELIKAGHESFGIIKGPHDTGPGAERTAGALSRLKGQGISDITSVRGDFGFVAGQECFSNLVQKRGSPPDAVIVANDAMALGCIDEARKKFGLKIPQDISIVGFDGTGPARLAAYDLTTIRQPVRRMAQAAAAMLIERIQNPELSPEKITFSGRLIQGSSARLQMADK